MSPTLRALALICLLFPASLPAALPDAVDGQPVPSLAPMLDRVLPSVVRIGTESRVVVNNPLFQDPIFRHFFGDGPSAPQERRTQGLGSGVIVDAERGFIVTNHHVIAQADRITVSLTDGRQFDAELVGADPDSDVAVVRIEPDDLSAVAFGDSERLRVGDFVVAIGNPFGLSHTVTSGIVSGLGRSGLGIEAYEDFIQTDASINPGNSGGALVDLQGRLVGINTAILGPNGGNIGIGFAIPVNMAREIMEQLIETGEVRRGQLGVSAQDLTPDLAQAFGIEQTQGVVIASVSEGSAADEAGLRPGDVVLEVNGKPVRSSLDMRNAVGLLRIGARVQMRVVRGGRTLDLVAQVAEPRMSTLRGEQLDPRLAGAVFAVREEGGEGGVVIAELAAGSAAARGRLQAGDLIRSVGRQPVRDLADLRARVEAAGDGPLVFNLQRGETALFLVIR
jgi:serine protease Do/serine protease DegQ